MTVSILASSIATRIKRQFGDESGVQITDADIIDWINDAQREVLTQNPGVLATSVTIDVTAVGQSGFTVFDNVITSNKSHSVRSVYYREDPTSQYVLMKYFTPQEWEERFGYHPTEEYGTPIVYTVRFAPDTGSNRPVVSVYPWPDHTQDDAFLVFYNRFPTDVVSLSNTIDLPAAYNQYIIEFCLMKAYEMDENWEAVDRKQNYIQSTLNHLADMKYANTQTYPVIMSHLMDED